MSLMKRLVNALFHRIGYIPAPLAACFRAMRRAGFRPKHINYVVAQDGVIQAFGFSVH